MQEKVATLITDYTQKLINQDKDFAEKLEIAAKAHDANLELLKSDYKVAAEDILKQINVHKKEVEDLVGVIGNLGVTSGYQKVANLARWMLFLWQGLTVVALSGLILVAVTLAFPSLIKSLPAPIDAPQNASLTVSQPTQKATEKTSPSLQATIQAAPVPSEAAFYQGLATRIFLSLTFGVFAAYAAKQASHFLEMERKNRKLALELEALGPYIAPLDKAKQDEFRIKIGDRSFGVHDNNSNTPKTNDPVTPYDVFSPKELGELIASAAKELR
jgi:hypothetical protein